MVFKQLSKTKYLYQWALVLAIFTIVYNIVEGVLATYFGYTDESLALFGFGLDSFIEFISGIGIANMVLRVQRHPKSNRHVFERRALQITGFSFFLLTMGLTVSGIYNIVVDRQPESAFWGIVIALISIAVMVALLVGKSKIGKKLNSKAILADAECTRVCIYMSVILLASSGIYALTGFGYIDSIGALGLAYFSFQEGRECFLDAKPM